MASKSSVLTYYLGLIKAAVPSVAWRITGGLLVSPKKSYVFLQRVLELRDVFDADPVLPSKPITEICPVEGTQPDVVIVGGYHSDRSSDTRQLKELASIGYLCQAARCRKIFEIGTFVGRMTRNLALNGGRQAMVYTLDLPRDAVPHDVGECYRGTTEANRIVQLHGDSRTFDYSPWHDTIDFCWVDACHDYEFVRNDSLAAFRMVHEGGWIGWHDYRHSATWSGVTRFVRELDQALGGRIIHIAGTTTAVVQVTAPMKQLVAGLR